ncbi:hypothetical protein M2140_000307 [Clostridiales Family XIII bacterium PM5-7]
MEYRGILKKRTKSKNIFAFVTCLVLLFLEITTKQYWYIPITLLAVFAVFHQKDHIVTEQGVDIRRSIFGITSDNRWSWDEITGLQPDYIKARPNASLLIEKNSTLRSFLFTPEDCEAVIALAKKMNPNIYVDYTTEEEQAEIERKNIQFREQQRAQREKEIAKRKKKK